MRYGVVPVTFSFVFVVGCVIVCFFLVVRVFVVVGCVIVCVFLVVRFFFVVGRAFIFRFGDRAFMFCS